MNKNQQIELAAQFYSLLIRLYPKKYVQTFHAEMVQTFKDNYRDLLESEGKVGLQFWVEFISDDLKGIGREQVVSFMKIPLVLLIVFCLLISSTVMTIRISPVFMVIMLTVIVITTLFFIKKLSFPVRKTSKKSAKKIWLKHGFFYGMLLGLFILPMNTVNMLTIQDVLSYQSVPLGILFLAGMPLLVILSGYTAGLWSKDTKQGLFSGLLTASIGAGFIVVSTIILMLVWEMASTNASSVSYMVGSWQNNLESTVPHFQWSPNLSANVVSTIIMLIFGAVLGAIGGFIGKKSAKL